MTRRRSSAAAQSLFAEPCPVPPPPAAERSAPRAPVVFAPTPPAERIEAVPGFLEAVLDADGCMHIGWRERDEPRVQEQRSHERATTPSPALVERLREVCPVTGLRGAVPGRLQILAERVPASGDGAVDTQAGSNGPGKRARKANAAMSVAAPASPPPNASNGPRAGAAKGGLTGYGLA